MSLESGNRGDEVNLHKCDTAKSYSSPRAIGLMVSNVAAVIQISQKLWPRGWIFATFFALGRSELTCIKQAEQKLLVTKNNNKQCMGEVFFGSAHFLWMSVKRNESAENLP